MNKKKRLDFAKRLIKMLEHPNPCKCCPALKDLEVYGNRRMGTPGAVPIKISRYKLYIILNDIRIM